MVKFSKFSKSEQNIINLIVDRAYWLFEDVGDRRDRLALEMDISAANANYPLRLSDLLEADDFNFAHDIGGISRNLDRDTGKIHGHFRPRFSK